MQFALRVIESGSFSEVMIGRFCLRCPIFLGRRPLKGYVAAFVGVVGSILVN